MATRHFYRLLAGLAALLWPLLAGGQSYRLDTERAAKVLEWHHEQLGTREKTGRNDGPKVEYWLRLAGHRPPAPYCGAYQLAGQIECGLTFPYGAAGSYNWFKPSSPRTYYIRGIRGSVDSIRPGHHVGFYYPNFKRIAHIGRAVRPTRIARRRNARGWVTNEGNTSGGGSREGQGVYELMRASWEFYAAANWIRPSPYKP